jgi:hypothetical protein
MKFKIHIVTNKAREAVIFDSFEALEAAGYQLEELSPDALACQRVLRPELRDRPRIKGMAGASWGGWRDANGEHVFLENDYDPASQPKPYSPSMGPIDHFLLRFEDWETCDLLSR